MSDDLEDFDALDDREDSDDLGGRTGAMTAEQIANLGQVLCDVLDGFGFMFAEIPEPGAPLPTPSAALVARVGFTGPQNGLVRVAVPGAFGPLLAANVLGLEDTDSPEAARFGRDTLGEMANVMAGRVTTALFGAQAVFDFAMPEVRDLSNAEWREFAGHADALIFQVEGHPLLLQVQTGGQTP
ncbi:MAG: hypothetical protein A3K19_09890 [Lentisphaerae bacterium RIFOXYB12_FULL_65_16]|nr:MAG: hypothetical protein A3K18_00625 [Lentisphaerae bacterium RIFOXYA12_64_32]OGV91264.1 MAG: hypothetical protein A3K19_09890 [Lentisphaerae bacterium RIFOXYB12_FULL_65_16]